MRIIVFCGMLAGHRTLDPQNCNLFGLLGFRYLDPYRVLFTWPRGKPLKPRDDS